MSHGVIEYVQHFVRLTEPMLIELSIRSPQNISVKLNWHFKIFELVHEKAFENVTCKPAITVMHYVVNLWATISRLCGKHQYLFMADPLEMYVKWAWCKIANSWYFIF